MRNFVTDIGTEELAHFEMIGAIVHQLTRNLSPEEIAKSGFDKYYVDHTLALWPQAAGGIPFNACEFQSKGDVISDLMEDMAAEQKARTTYDNILRLVKDPEVCEPIRFLRAREIVHFQRFGDTKLAKLSRFCHERMIEYRWDNCYTVKEEQEVRLMGIYLNPGNKGFWKSIRSEIYVDKTGLIACTNKLINTEEQFICVSRPRRFGKSMALKMLAAYYSRGCDSSDLFKGFQIENDETFQDNLNQFDVIFLNMQQFFIEAEPGKVTEYLEQEVFRELQKEYNDILNRQNMGLAAALREIFAETDRQFIFLIDEWDCVMRERQESEDLQKQYLDFLRNLLKDQPYVALAYMTGILPVKKYGQHSALNMFWEYSMTDQFGFEEYTGFTEQEVKELCEKYDMNFEQTSNWYDGYKFRQFQHIYNPRSVVAAMKSRVLSNYWTTTETYDALKIYIDMDFDGLRSDIVQMLGGERVKVNTLSFRNDMCNLEIKDDVLTLLIHLGYLGYDSEKKEAFIPNKEIIGEFENAMRVSGWSEVMRILKASEKLLEDTLRGDAESVAKALDQAHTEAASILTYNDENALGCAIGLAYYSARKDYRLIRELPTGRGFADVVFLPLPSVNKPALVIELKYDKTAYAAIQQIKDRQYTQALEGYVGEILTVGISYDKDDVNKSHRCVIERVRKK